MSDVEPSWRRGRRERNRLHDIGRGAVGGGASVHRVGERRRRQHVFKKRTLHGAIGRACWRSSPKPRIAKPKWLWARSSGGWRGGSFEHPIPSASTKAFRLRHPVSVVSGNPLTRHPMRLT
eukprot:2756690-Pyramimonas_sp.AAC.1